MRFSIVLVDGLGNNLFQLSFLYQFACKHQITHLLSIRLWDDLIFGRPAFGGHPRKVPLSMGQVFPRMPYEEAKSLRDSDVMLTYAKHDSGFHDWSLDQILSKVDKDTTDIVFSGWFFHYKYHMTYRREWIDWMKFSPLVTERIPKLPYSQTVSVHLRLGSVADTSAPVQFDYERVLMALRELKERDSSLTHVLVCSETEQRVKELIPQERWAEEGFEYHFLDEDIEVCLYASIQCAHHCLANSTLSYMIAYMDPKFPDHAVAYYDNFGYLLEPVMDPELMKGFREYPKKEST